MLRFIIFTMGILVGTVTFVSAQITGKVYFDANGNGKLDQGEQGVSSVAVQDGLNVVVTAKDGTFRLPGHETVRFVTLTSPNGYQASPCHYLPFEGVEKEYCLGLIKNPISTTGEYSFVQITDTETSLYKEWVDNLKEYVKSNPTAFVIHTGDICYEAHQDFHGRNLRTTDIGVPVYYCVGNHDLRAGKYGEALFESHFGPVWYSFDIGSVHYIVTPMLGGDYAPSYKRNDMIRWLKNDLRFVKQNQKVVLFNHDLWFGEDNMILKGSAGEQIDFSTHGLEAVIYGHWHNHYYKQFASGLHTYCTSPPDKGGIDHGPSCFRVFNVGRKGELASETRYSYIDGLLTSVCPAEGEQMVCSDGKMNVRVNVYRTVSRTKKVTVAIEREGRKIATAMLTPETDWAWSGYVKVGVGRQRLLLTAEFEDGTLLTKRVDYSVGKDKQPVEKKEREWAGLRGNAAHNVVVKDTLTMPLQVNWVQNAGSNVFMSSPLVADGKVFVATIDDDRVEKCGVKAFDEADGKLCWVVKTASSVKNSIAYAQGVVFVSDAAGILYAIDAKKGTINWQIKLPMSVLPLLNQGLVVENGVVYAGQGSGVCAVQAVDGKILWKNTAWRGGESTSSTMTVGDGVVVASAHWNGLFGHDVSDGSLLWKKQDGKIRFRDGSPTFYDGNFYLASSDRIYLINPRSGDILKMGEASCNFNSACAPFVTERFVIVGTSDKGVVAFDRLTFKEVWSYRTEPAIFYTVPYVSNQECSVEVSPVLLGDKLVFGASDGFLHVVDVATGAFRGKRALGAPVFSSVAVGGNALYVTDFAGNVYSFRL